MDEQTKRDSASHEVHSANPGYALSQLAHALTTSQGHPDAATRERALQKIGRWIQVFQGMLSGALTIGSRTPVANTPPWATLEVVKGGFATGSLLAAGPLQRHEEALLAALAPSAAGSERATLNSYFLSEEGFAELQALLASGHYRLNVPEEGALLAVAWLATHGDVDTARDLLEVLGPFMEQLRFYPVPAERPFVVSEVVYRQDVGQTLTQLQAVQVGEALARERESVLVWAPLYDRAVALWQETVEGELPFVPGGDDGQPQRQPSGHYVVAGGWPCQHYPVGWAERARALLDDYGKLRAEHQRSGKPERPSEAFPLLRGSLTRCVADPRQLTGREVGQIRALLAGFAHKRGRPGSQQHAQLRQMQTQRATRPTKEDFAQVLLQRLALLPQDEGIEELASALADVTADEARTFKLAAGLPIPTTLQRKVERSMAAPVELLVAREIIPSSEALARVIPQLSAHVRVTALENAELRRLYSALYTAFRRRRSLLLLNLEHQVKFSELPWVTALELYRPTDEQSQARARDLLQRVVALALTAFPQQILPNTLLREVRALAESAGLALPIVDEVAADIFMGQFSEKYLRAAQWAGRLLAGSLYERYYGLNYARVLGIDDVAASRYGTPTSLAFDRLCHELAAAGAGKSSRSVARNGTIIEQEQILTTHNLALLFDALELRETLGPQLGDMARRCFAWICKEQQTRRGSWTSNLRMLKNTAYAWRQMLFLLALQTPDEVTAFLIWAAQHLAAQPASLTARLRPALDGLAYAAAGYPIEPPARRFLGWTTERHWLMPES